MRKSAKEGFLKSNSPEKLIKLHDGGDSIMNELKYGNIRFND